MKKNLLNIFFQFVFLALIVKVFFFDETEFDKFILLKHENFTLLIFFCFLINYLTTFLFNKIITSVSLKKINYLDLTSLHMQGALINEILPAVGYLFRYYKLNLSSNINIVEYSISQFLWSFFSLLIYFLSAILLGFIVINSNLEFFFIVILVLITYIFIIKFRKRIYKFIKQILIKFKKTKSFIDNLKNAKKLLLKNKIKFFFIFIGFAIKLLLELYLFYLAFNFFEIDISILQTAYILISSKIITLLLLFNFFGLFEIIFTISATFIVPEIQNILIFAVSLKTIHLISVILIITKILVLKKLIIYK